MRSLRQIKDMIKNVAKVKKLNSQVLLRNYMMERFLERIALSRYNVSRYWRWCKFYLSVRMENINALIFRDALKATAISRGTIKFLKNGKEVIEEVLSDDILKSHWIRYQKKYDYAKDVSWKMVSKSLEELWFLYNDK